MDKLKDLGKSPTSLPNEDDIELLTVIQEVTETTDGANGKGSPGYIFLIWF
jgi:hypothetical protein